MNALLKLGILSLVLLTFACSDSGEGGTDSGPKTYSYRADMFTIDATGNIRAVSETGSRHKAFASAQNYARNIVLEKYEKDAWNKKQTLTLPECITTDSQGSHDSKYYIKQLEFNEDQTKLIAFVNQERLYAGDITNELKRCAFLVKESSTTDASGWNTWELVTDFDIGKIVDDEVTNENSEMQGAWFIGDILLVDVLSGSSHAYFSIDDDSGDILNTHQQNFSSLETLKTSDHNGKTFIGIYGTVAKARKFMRFDLDGNGFTNISNNDMDQIIDISGVQSRVTNLHSQNFEHVSVSENYFMLSNQCEMQKTGRNEKVACMCLDKLVPDTPTAKDPVCHIYKKGNYDQVKAYLSPDEVELVMIYHKKGDESTGASMLLTELTEETDADNAEQLQVDFYTYDRTVAEHVYIDDIQWSKSYLYHNMTYHNGNITFNQLHTDLKEVALK